MKVTITPSAARGIIEAPPSKSMAHRLLICAGLAEGLSVITNVDLSRDIEATIACLRALGARIEYEKGRVNVRGTGLAGLNGPGTRLVPSSLRGERHHPFPDPRLSAQRAGELADRQHDVADQALQVYEDICREQGLTFEKGQKDLLVGGRLAAGEYVLPGDVSSQFISGLLFALPLLEGDSGIRLVPPVESRPYIDMTLQALRQFGVRADWIKPEDPLSGKKEDLPCALRIPGKQKYQPQAGLRVEGDYSNAAFFEALGMLNKKSGTSVPDAQSLPAAQGDQNAADVLDTSDAQASGDAAGIQVTGLAENSLQGDRIYRTYLAGLDDGFVQIDLSDCPDLGPVLMAFAAARHGARFTGTRRLKIKESDRGTAMQQELAKMGVRVDMAEDEITVFSGIRPPREHLYGHNDHRIVMALSILLTRTGGTIDGAEAVAKSLPDFFERMTGLGIQVSYEP